MAKKNRIKPSRAMIGFGFGGIPDPCMNIFFSNYFLLFLTTVVKMDAAKAGTVASSVILTDAIMSIFVGRITDGLKNPNGRRRPILLVTTFTLPFAFICMFRNVQAAPGVQMAYYMASGILFWASFSFYYISYVALGADCAEGYEERILMHSYSRFGGVLAAFMTTSGAMALIGYLEKRGAAEPKAWGTTTLLLGIFTAAMSLIAWYLTRGVEKVTGDAVKPQPLKYMLKDFKELLSIKPYRVLMYGKGCEYVVSAMASGALVFYMKFVMDEGQDFISFVYAYKQVIGFFMVFVITALSLKFGKRNYIIGACCSLGLVMVCMYFFGGGTRIALLVFSAAVQMAESSFWQLINTNFYDIADLDEYKHYVRREGNVMALQSFLCTLVTSLATKVFALLLQASGFDGTLQTQSPEALSMLSKTLMLIPGIAIIGVGVSMIFYKVTKERFEVLESYLQDRRAGRPLKAEDEAVIEEMFV